LVATSPIDHKSKAGEMKSGILKTAIVFITVLFLATSCKEPCQICEVLHGEQLLESYAGCDQESIEVSKSVCEQMALIQSLESVCVCREQTKEDKASRAKRMSGQ
jgi:hypothetical protein